MKIMILFTVGALTLTAHTSWEKTVHAWSRGKTKYAAGNQALQNALAQAEPLEAQCKEEKGAYKIRLYPADCDYDASYFGQPWSCYVGGKVTCQGN